MTTQLNHRQQLLLPTYPVLELNKFSTRCLVITMRLHDQLSGVFRSKNIPSIESSVCVNVTIDDDRMKIGH